VPGGTTRPDHKEQAAYTTYFGICDFGPLSDVNVEASKTDIRDAFSALINK
jgi:hypothetical protein